MNRNEFLEALPITRITLKLIGATLEICSDDIDDIHVMVSGADRDVENLRIAVQADQLIVEQPATALAKNPVGTSWMQLTIRLPRTWKGRIDGRTVSGWINARSLTGADLALESVSGMITATDMDFITISLKAVTGDVKLIHAGCEKCTLASTSGDVRAEAVSLLQCGVTNIAGNAALSLVSPFEEITATSVTGDVVIDAPVEACDAVLRSVAGRIRTSGVSIVEGAAKVRVTTVSGGLDITRVEIGESVYPQFEHI